MKSKLILALLACCFSIGSAYAQCAAQFSYSTTPTGGWVTFYVDSTIGLNAATTVYTWSFGDGTSGTSSQIAHQYNALIGSYTVCLSAHDTAGGGCSTTTCDTINLGGGTACSATISYTDSGRDYTFAATSTGTGPYTYSWTVDGQQASTLASPTIALAPINTYYTVCVNITDSSGCAATTCVYVFDTVSNPSTNCSAYITLTGQQDSTYTFSVSALNSGSSSYVWTYGNNTIAGSGTATVVIDSAALALRPTICVAVTDATGCTASDCITLGGSATGGGCQSYFVIYPDSVNTTQGYYTGINLSTGNYGQNVLWSFGDGSTSTSPYPTHTYATPGNYTICLTVGAPGTTCYDTYCDSSFYVFKTDGGPMSHLTIQGPNGIHDISSDAQVTIYPNPATDVLTIGTTERVDEQKIYDIKGQLVMDIKANTNQINVSKLSAGIYVLELNINGAFSRSKFVKE